MQSYKDYYLLETLGEGSFGKVKLGRRDNKLYAIKFPTRNNAYSEQMLQRIFSKEACILNKLKHSNIIRLEEAVENGLYRKSKDEQKGVFEEHRYALVFYYAPYDLGEILYLGELPEVMAKTIFAQLLNAIQYLHSENVIHRDIKPQNILFDYDYNLKLCDFGLSFDLDGPTKPKTFCGSNAFKSPEILMKKYYNGVMNDLFAAGVSLFLLVAGQPPFITAQPHNGLYKFIAFNQTDKFWESHRKQIKFSDELKSLLNSMLAFDPTHRLTIPYILSHPWMSGYMLGKEKLKAEMKRMEAEGLYKKRAAMFKEMQKKLAKDTAGKHKRDQSEQSLEEPLLKKPYTYIKRLSGRMVPRLQNECELRSLFGHLSDAELHQRNKQWQLIKVVSQDTYDKLVVYIVVEEFNQEADVIKFKLIEGDTLAYYELMRQFDHQFAQQL